ncbi:MAG: pilus assembly protein PilB [Fischerella sp.]|nr:pilus assembly protein PilB [Fischerella sp.]
MFSSEGKPTDTRASTEQEVLSDTLTPWEQRLEREQIFRLIENLLSFEACLYHQVLPLKIEDNSLLLGMVNPEDGAALHYVCRILSYINCKLIPLPITSDRHRHILSEYLNHKNTSPPQVPQQPQPPVVTAQKESTRKNCEQMLASINIYLEPSQKPTAFLAQPATPENSLSHSDSPIEVDSDATIHPKTEAQPEHTVDSPTTAQLTVLSLPAAEEFSPVEVLLTLPPKKLLEELLGRVLAGGIGRLYLERLPYTGRILWSENGVLQSVLEKVPLSVFQGVMNELKRFGSLPVITLAEPKQVERECLYQQDRLLLRLRVMPGMYGEEATLQVLRGAALKFYQQQQLTRLSRDALGISQQLSYKLHELQERLLLNRSVSSSQLETFNALNQLLHDLDHHIKMLSAESSQLPTRPTRS